MCVCVCVRADHVCVCVFLCVRVCVSARPCQALPHQISLTRLRAVFSHIRAVLSHACEQYVKRANPWLYIRRRIVSTHAHVHARATAYTQTHTRERIHTNTHTHTHILIRLADKGVVYLQRAASRRAAAAAAEPGAGGARRQGPMMLTTEMMCMMLRLSRACNRNSNGCNGCRCSIERCPPDQAFTARGAAAGKRHTHTFDNTHTLSHTHAHTHSRSSGNNKGGARGRSIRSSVVINQKLQSILPNPSPPSPNRDECLQCPGRR